MVFMVLPKQSFSLNLDLSLFFLLIRCNTFSLNNKQKVLEVSETPGYMKCRAQQSNMLGKNQHEFKPLKRHFSSSVVSQVLPPGAHAQIQRCEAFLH